MKNMIRSAIASLILFVTCMAHGAVPPIDVTVSDAGGKAAFKGATNAKGTFATANLKPGNYVVQFNSKSPTVKGNHYALVVSAGSKKVSASAVPGEKLAAGGVAMKVTVGPGLNITGQVSSEAEGSVNKNGKKMVWIPPQLGSNMGGRWVEEGSPEAVAARTSGRISTKDIQDIQNRGISPGQ
jgi:hypothetical protein